MAPKPPTLFKHAFNFNDYPFYVGRHSLTHAIKPPAALQWLHTHPGLEVGGIIAGDGVQYFNGKQFPMKQGDIFLIDPIYPHEVTGTTDLDLVVSHLSRESVVAAHIDRSHMALMEPFSALQGGMPPVVSGMGECVAGLVKAWEFYSDKSELGRQRAFLAIVGVLSEVAQRTKAYRAADVDDSWRKNHDLVSRATEYINARFAEDFSLDDLAKHCDVSKSRMSHAFKEFAGDSPIGLRTRIRISRAVDLLKTTDAKVSTVALECGFNDFTAFYRLFKKKTGVTPAEIRKGITPRAA